MTLPRTPKLQFRRFLTSTALACSAALALGPVGCALLEPGSTPLEATAPAHTTGQLRPLVEEPPLVELAPYMADLQRLTHKLSLSVGADNAELAAFYAYESIEALKTIQADVPDYRGQPIAVLVGRLGIPAAEQVASAARAGDLPALASAQAAFIESCNTCHALTAHPFIRITDDAKRNPFNQDFRP